MTNAKLVWWRRPLWPWSRLSAWQGWLLSVVIATVIVFVATRVFVDLSPVLWLLLLWQVSQAAIKARRASREAPREG